jgi:proteasome lid subunit RPN8/RPN11
MTMVGRAGKLREVCYLVDHEGQILWRDTSDDASYLEDSRDRWTTIWEMRGEIAVIAHSHPCGPLGFSEEDLTTMRALWRALGASGEHIAFAVVAPGGTRLSSKEMFDVQLAHHFEPEWIDDLRRKSGMRTRSQRQLYADLSKCLSPKGELSIVLGFLDDLVTDVTRRR